MKSIFNKFLFLITLILTKNLYSEVFNSGEYNPLDVQNNLPNVWLNPKVNQAGKDLLALLANYRISTRAMQAKKDYDTEVLAQKNATDTDSKLIGLNQQLELENQKIKNNAALKGAQQKLDEVIKEEGNVLKLGDITGKAANVAKSIETSKEFKDYKQKLEDVKKKVAKELKLDEKNTSLKELENTFKTQYQVKSRYQDFLNKAQKAFSLRKYNSNVLNTSIMNAIKDPKDTESLKLVEVGLINLPENTDIKQLYDAYVDAKNLSADAFQTSFNAQNLRKDVADITQKIYSSPEVLQAQSLLDQKVQQLSAAKGLGNVQDILNSTQKRINESSSVVNQKKRVDEIKKQLESNSNINTLKSQIATRKSEISQLHNVANLKNDLKNAVGKDIFAAQEKFDNAVKEVVGK